MNLINCIIAPASAPQIAVPSLPAPTKPHLDRLDQVLLQALRDAGDCPVWSLFNAVVIEEGVEDRFQARQLRRDLWYRLKGLRRLGLAFFHGRHMVSATRPAPSKRPVTPRRRPSVALRRPVRQDRGTQPSPPARSPFLSQGTQNEPPKSNNAPARAREESPQVETAEDASQAARALATRPRQPKRKWTGWLHGQHCWRNRRIILPSGEVGFLYGCIRGKVIFTLDEGRLLGGFGEPLRWGVLREDQIRLWKDPLAVRLGKRKAGVKERPSELKRRVARENGRRPCGPGKRCGRPPKTRTNSPLPEKSESVSCG